MSNELERWVGVTVIGLVIAASGCADDQPGDENSDETGGEPTGGDPTSGGPTTGTDPTAGPDNGPLELELAAFNKTGQFLLLRFSEPMAPVDGVDPADFRVSLAFTWRYTYYGTYESSNYVDPNYGLVDYCYYYNCNPAPLMPDLVVNGKLDTDIVIRFANPMTAEGCANYEQMKADYAELDNSPEYDARVALFPHYSPGAVPVMSQDGETLPAIGPEWVEWPENYMDLYGEFGWPNLDPQVEILCLVSNEP